MSITIGVISGVVTIGTLGIGYCLYNFKHKSNSKPEIKVKELKQEQEVQLSQKTYAPLNYIPKNTKPTSKTTYSSNKSRKSNNYVEDDDNLLISSIGFGIISSPSDSDDCSHKHSYHSSHSYHDLYDSGSHSSYDSSGSSDSGGCDCGGCD